MSCAYLAGPRTGIDEYNTPAFETAAANLRERGWTIISPTELDENDGDGMDPAGDGAPLPEMVYLRGLENCVKAMLASSIDAVIVLPGWEESRGAALEVRVATEFGKAVLRYPDLDPVVSARHPASARFHEVLRGLAALHDRKQADYGRGDDPFANVRASDDFGVPGWIGTAMRANDKMKRLQTAATQYLTTGRVSLANEGILDAFDDLAVYAVIGRVLYEESASSS